MLCSGRLPGVTQFAPPGRPFDFVTTRRLADDAMLLAGLLPADVTGIVGVPRSGMIAASIIAVLAERLRIPYTVSLVLGGLLLGALRLPILSPLQAGHRPEWLTPDVILILFLPALIFEASVKIDVRRLIKDFVLLLLLA